MMTMVENNHNKYCHDFRKTTSKPRTNKELAIIYPKGFNRNP